MMWARGLVGLVSALAVEGCSDTQTSADCSLQVRVDAMVYTSHGHTQSSATAFSTAQEAECDDVGEDPAGSVFPETPTTVTTWKFPGYAPTDVVGVRSGDAGSFAVFVADSVPQPERERIYQDLAGEH